MTSHWKAILGVILIYLFGCFSGILTTSIFVRHKMIDFLKHPAVAASAALEKRLTGNLHLDADQKQQIHAYFMENLDQRRAVQKQIQPQVQMLNRKTFQQISSALHPDQVEMFHQNLEKFRRRFAETALDKDAENLIPASTPPAAPATNSGTGSPPGQ